MPAPRPARLCRVATVAGLPPGSPATVAQGKASSVAEALADTQAELEVQSAIPSPSTGKESGKESADSAKLQSDCALNEVMK